MLIKIGALHQQEYKGIFEMAAHGLHADVFNILKPYLSKEMHILDFGCGQGAFSQRLVDAGMKVDACDIDVDQIRAGVNRRIKLDLNQDISLSFSQKYDALIALEIIEHLENPWKYLRDCCNLLTDDGIIVLSTPNVSNFASRLRFIMRGTLLAFEIPDLNHGHITPLTFVQLENMFAKNNLTVIKRSHAGALPIFHFNVLSRFSILRNTLIPILYPFMVGPKNGRSIVYVLKKNK